MKFYISSSWEKNISPNLKKVKSFGPLEPEPLEEKNEVPEPLEKNEEPEPLEEEKNEEPEKNSPLPSPENMKVFSNPPWIKPINFSKVNK